MQNRKQTRAGLVFMLLCYLLWGLQPLYWQLDSTFDYLFLIAARTVSAAVLCLLLLAVLGKLRLLRDVFCSPKVLARELPAALFLFGDWFVFIWAVQNRQVLECSVGYYIQPLVVFAFGAVLYHEKCRPYHFAALAFLAAGIAVSAVGLRTLPWVSISLALMFAIYAAIKKSLTIDPIVSTTSEILLMTPFMLAYLLLGGRPSLALVDGTRLLFLLGAGVVTAAPMLLYALAVKRLRLMTLSVSQYLSPTLGIVCSLLLREEITPMKWVSLGLIWIGVLIYAGCTLRDARKTPIHIAQ